MHIAPRRWLGPLIAVLTGGCAPSLPELSIERVEPSWAFNGDETTLTISGDGLYPSVSVAAGGERPRIDAQFSVLLESGGSVVPLEGVELRDYGELAARVPAGVEPDRYDLRVTSPSGATALLSKALLVTDSRADHFGLDLDLRAYTVNETVSVDISLLDNVDEPVPDDVEVFVSFESDLNGEGLLIDATGLLNAFIDDEAHTITGRLSGEGRGGFSFTSTLPDNVNLTVSPLDADSIVRDATIFVPFTAGNEEFVAVELPSEGFTTTAGETFDVNLYLVDEFGNVLTDRSASVFLREICGGADGMPRDAVGLVGGIASVNVSLHRATSDRPTSTCVANGVEVYGQHQGQSELVLVRPAAVESLAVLVAGGEDEVVVSAGEPELSAVVRAEDPFGNAVVDYAANIHFTDSVNGLDSRGEQGSVACFPWIDGLLPCVIALDVAGEGVVLYAETDTGVRGHSVPFDVRGGPASDLILTLPGGPIVAGTYFQLEVQVTDRLGNPVDLDLSSEGLVEISDDHGGTSCTYAAAIGPGDHAFGCLSTVADPGVLYTVALPSLAITRDSSPVEVVNGALSRIEITLPSSVVAGASFTLTGSASDAWGNPYRTGDPSITLVDSTGTLVPSAASISGSGQISATVSISRADEAVEVSAVRGPTIYGSATFTVEPGALDHYGVEPENIWVWQGDSLSVAISALDAYDNIITTHTGSISVSSAQSLFLSETRSDFEDGVVLEQLTWDGAGLADRVMVSDGVITGSSVAIDALNADCADPPTSVVELDGSVEVTPCLTSGGATVTADFSQSSLGGAGLSHFIFDDGQGSPTRTGSTSRSVTYSQAGLYRTQLLVVDTSACAALGEAIAWVNDKGAPAGELSVSLSHSTRTAGGASSDADATVSVSAYDCAGDRAASSLLCARTDLGELSAGLSSTGTGLCMTLDSSGQGSFTWSAQNLDYDGTASIVVGVPSGAAYGLGHLSVLGDNHRPEVASWEPGGRLLDTVDSVSIHFTEPLASLNYNSRVTLAGPNGVVATSTTLQSGDQELLVTPLSTVDGALGAWTLTLSSLIRDDSGNRLSGDWSGSVSSFTLYWGDVNDTAPDLLSCEAASSTLVPDGDNGSGAEADGLALALQATATPSWWRLEVYDAAGVLRRTLHEPATSSADTLTWDARGDDGRVVSSGEWELAVYAIDSLSNVSDPCFASVEVIERYGAP